MSQEMQTQSHLSMLKAALPYFPSSSQKNILMLLKIIEIRRVMNEFDLEQEKTLSACEGSSRSIEGLCGVLKGFCTDKEKEVLDTWTNLFQAMNLFREYASHSPQTEINSNPMDMLQNILTPEQKSMMDTYKNLIHNATPQQ